MRLQSSGIMGGAVISTSNGMKVVLYLVHLAFAVYWATLSHWLYVWDEILWIGGFAAIEMNVSEWRTELVEEQQAA